jgi:hypothetical protein
MCKFNIHTQPSNNATDAIKILQKKKTETKFIELAYD